MAPSTEQRLAELETRVQSLQQRADADDAAKRRDRRARTIVLLVVVLAYGAYFWWASQLL